ncbi:MAG: hypothetical protein LBE53_00425, partial [Paucimonas sp.]|nr:hypothetical protein [Paucimonas sp.]
RNRKSSSGSWDGGLGEGSWTEGYFSTGQMTCADLFGESLNTWPTEEKPMFFPKQVRNFLRS